MGGLKTPCIVFAGYIDPKGIRPTGQRQCRRCNADAAKRLAERRAAA